VKTSTLEVASPNGPALHTHRWLPDGATRASLLIVHGMAEHGARYARFAKALTDAGIAVYALDLPGHGRTADPADLGHFADRNGWSVALAAIHAVHSSINERDRKRPLFLMGHSMGSFLVQHYVVEHGAKLDGAILSATSGDLGMLRAIGLALIRAEALIFGRRHRSALAEAISFKEFNKKFKPNRTAFDWLSRDDSEVDKYIADPLCGFRCTTGLWIDLLKAGARLDDIARLSRIPKSLPVLLIAGAADPACNGAAGPRALEQAYRAAGLKDVTASLYDGARHELLNETCRDAVTAELRDWMAAHL
jgi:alpha-beta hydrolase superfamily lysophospholipase